MMNVLPTLAGLSKSFGFYVSPANIAHFLLNALGSTDLGDSSGHLDIIDSRTGRKYVMPIENNSVNALEFRRITAASRGADHVDQFETGLKILDHGFFNTACMKSSVTFMYVTKRSSLEANNKLIMTLATAKGELSGIVIIR